MLAVCVERQVFGHPDHCLDVTGLDALDSHGVSRYRNALARQAQLGRIARKEVGFEEDGVDLVGEHGLALGFGGANPNALSGIEFEERLIAICAQAGQVVTGRCRQPGAAAE